MEAYLPKPIALKISTILADSKIHLKIVPPRKSCLGFWRYSGGKHSISINNNLSPEQFFMTLTHEIAHARTWDVYKGHVKPHGKEWKLAYREVAEPLLLGHFKLDFEDTFRKHLKNPTASSMTKVNVASVATPDATYLADLSIGTSFRFVGDNRVFVLMGKRRVNYDILEVRSEKMYVGKAAGKVSVC
jgi:hypothetical protein